jgi:hypothetical protein
MNRFVWGWSGQNDKLTEIWQDENKFFKFLVMGMGLGFSLTYKGIL